MEGNCGVAHENSRDFHVKQNNLRSQRKLLIQSHFRQKKNGKITTSNLR